MYYYLTWLDKNRNYILLLALLIRLIIVINISIEPINGGDSFQYDQLALSVKNGDGFSFLGEASALRAPVYPLFLALIYKIFGHNYLVVMILQSFIELLTIIIVYKMIFENFGKRRAILSLILFCFHPGIIIYTSRILTETLFTLFLSLAFYYLMKAHKSLSLKYSVFSGFIFGICVLTKPTPIGLIGFLFLSIIFMNEKIKRAKVFIIFSLISILTIMPWSMRNYFKMNEITLISNSSFGHMMFIGSYKPWDLEPKGWDNPPLDSLLKGLHVANDAKIVEKILVKESLNNIKSDFIGYCFLCAKKLKNLWFRQTKLENIKNADLIIFILTGINFFIVGTFIFGLFSISKMRYSHIILLNLFIYWSILHALTWGAYRYLVPILPFIFCYSSSGIMLLVNKYSKLKYS